MSPVPLNPLTLHTCSHEALPCSQPLHFFLQKKKSWPARASSKGSSQPAPSRGAGSLSTHRSPQHGCRGSPRCSNSAFQTQGACNSQRYHLLQSLTPAKVTSKAGSRLGPLCSAAPRQGCPRCTGLCWQPQAGTAPGAVSPLPQSCLFTGMVFHRLVSFLRKS